MIFLNRGHLPCILIHLPDMLKTLELFSFNSDCQCCWDVGQICHGQYPLNTNHASIGDQKLYCRLERPKNDAIFGLAVKHKINCLLY